MGNDTKYSYYCEMAKKLMDKAREIDAVSIEQNNGCLLISSNELEMSFALEEANGAATFYDWDYLVILYYNSEQEQQKFPKDFIKDEHLPVEERLKILLENTDTPRDVIERMKSFVEKLEELAKDERANAESVQPDNAVLLNLVGQSGVRYGDTAGAQQVLIGEMQPEQNTDKLNTGDEKL